LEILATYAFEMLSSLTSCGNYDVEFMEHKSYEDSSLDIFEMITRTSEPMAKLDNIELLIFKRFQMDLKKIKCLLQWRQKHESMLPIVGFLAQQILGIVGSQIETKRITYLISIFTNLRRCHLQ
jgi:hypothetical protein